MLVADVSKDPRYIPVVEDIRSELVMPLMVQDRCIGVFDLESPELDAFKKSDIEIMTLFASQAAVAIENARLYETIRANEDAAGEGDSLRAARADRRCCRPNCRSGSKAWTSRRGSSRRTSSAATSTTS